MNSDSMLGLLATQLLGQSGPTFWMPPVGSRWAQSVDWIFYYIYYIAVFFFLLIVGLMVLFVIRYRRRPGHEAQPSPSHNTPLEALWSGIPIILVVTMFWFGFRSFMDRAVIPLNAYEIQVVGQKWSWQFQHPTGYVDSSLHVPVDRMVQLTLTSNDVIHSLFIPVLRMKQDAVPGRYTKTWFRAELTGEFPLLCAEYCGTGHSDMLTTMVVHPPGEFEQWLERASNFLETMSPVEGGQRVYQLRGCKQCHSIDGTAGIGPTFKNLFGHPVQLVSGQTMADENYIRQSILEPNAHLVAGFDPVMPRIQISDQEIGAIIAYIKSLSDAAPATQPAGQADTAAAAGEQSPAPATQPAP